MSPEQAWGRAIDRRSDIFALAAVLFELLTGRKLFSGDNELSILEQVREARVTPPSQINDEVTPEIDRVVLKALQKDPENRYQTAGEMAREIDQILYAFRPTPTSADLAIFMHRLSTTEPVRHHPDLDETVIEEPPAVTPVVAPMAPPVAAAVPPPLRWFRRRHSRPPLDVRGRAGGEESPDRTDRHRRRCRHRHRHRCVLHDAGQGTERSAPRHFIGGRTAEGRRHPGLPRL